MMNYKQADKVKHLAPRVMKVLEGLEWECDVCKGMGLDLPDPKTLDVSKKSQACRNCKGEGKIHYSWTPQIWDLCLYTKPDDINATIMQVKDYNPETGDLRIEQCNGWTYDTNTQFAKPILEWEEIERVLEKAGYSHEIYDLIREDGEYVYCIWLDNNDGIPQGEGRGKSRQEAVMKAVLELGKELK